MRLLPSLSNTQASVSEKKVENTHPMVFGVQKLQTTSHMQITKKYNAAYLILTFNIGDVVTLAILAKDWAINNAARMEAWIIDILHEN